MRKKGSGGNGVLSVRKKAMLRVNRSMRKNRKMLPLLWVEWVLTTVL